MESATGLDTCRVVRIEKPRRPFSKNPIVRALRGMAEYWVLPGSSNSHAAHLVLGQTAGMRFDPDVIWATAPGYSVFLIASSLSLRLGVPWVADFRDLADQYVVYPWWVRRVMAWRERQFCRSAAHITTTAPNFQILRRRHGVPVTFIPNAYDPDELCESPKEPARDKFRLVYTGSVQGRQDPWPFIQAVHELIEAHRIPADRILMEFHGFLGRRARRSCRPGIRPPAVDIRIGAWLPRQDTLRLQREATVLLLLGVPGAPCAVLPGKLFEYMAAGRPVLAFPTDGAGITPILQATGIGRSCDTVEELKATLLQWYREWEATGDIHRDRNPEAIQQYSRKEQAGQLAAVLDRVVNA